MTVANIVCALPPSSNTGWGTAARRITEELGNIAIAHDIRETEFLNDNSYPLCFEAPVIQAVRGVDMMPMYPHLYSHRRVGLSFCEDNILLKRYSLNAQQHFDEIVCGSTWGRQCMIASGVQPSRVAVAIQGVDADVFKPGPGLVSTRETTTFNIWSCGKFEYRKSHDVVIRAVGVLMERHKDVRLVAAWHNPWPPSEATMAQSKLIKWTGSQLDACCQYLDMSRVELLDPMPHGHSAAYINGCDVGLFPNRCEAGTNLPLMEAMSCGLPVIATVEHGHADVTKHLPEYLIIPASLTPIHRGGMHVADWYEPDLEATITRLELAYNNWRGCESDNSAVENRAVMAQFTWANCARSLLEVCTK